MNEQSSMNNFKAIDTTSLVDKVEKRLVELLQRRKLKIGDIIPKELELSEFLGVSRTVVREALTRLRLMGMIETKKKRGTVITSPDIFKNLSRSMNPYILSVDTLRDLFEIRLALEIGMADFLFERCTKEDINELYEIIGEEPPLPELHQFDVEVEIAFHGKLYKITGNKSLMDFQQMLLPIFDYVNKQVFFQKQSLLKTFVSHKGLVDILKSGTPDKFRNGMRRHLENHFARIFD